MGGEAMKDAEVLVGIDVIPIGPSTEECEGGVVRLIRDEGTPDETSLACGMSGPQCRELARQLLIIADAASKGGERTVFAVTSTAMWGLPGQALIVRFAPDLNCQFVVPMPGPRNVARPKKRALLLPNGLPASVLRA
jgi:hypothetical protein